MAGLVPVDLMATPAADAPLCLIARICPEDQAYGRACVKIDERTGAIAVCPFWYGTVVVSGPHPWEIRSLDSLRQWMSTARGMQWRGYQTRCLHEHAPKMEAGARL